MIVNFRKVLLILILFVLTCSFKTGFAAEVNGPLCQFSFSYPFLGSNTARVQFIYQEKTCTQDAYIKVALSSTNGLIGFFSPDLLLVSFTSNSGYNFVQFFTPLQIATNTVITLNSVPAGTYNVTVTLVKYHPVPPFGILKEDFTATCNNSFVIRNLCSGITFNCSPSPENCMTLNDGSISTTLSQNPPYGPYTYTLQKVGSTGTTTNGSGAFNNLVTGTYNITVTDQQGNTASCSKTVGVNPNNTVSLNGLNLPPYLCLDAPPLTLTGATPTGGTFAGPGILNNIFTAKNAGAGTHNLTYTITPPRPGCNASANTKIMVLPKPPYINRVISATAMPYTDAWPVDFTDANATNNLSNLNSNNNFNTGVKGIWRGEESYVYVEERKQRTPTVINPNVNIKMDGIYDTLPLYLYNIGDMSGCNPNWRKMNTMTKYNPYSYEIENKDVLNRKSSALYGYRGDLSTAVAANAEEKEIAYNGFEEYTTGVLSSADVAAGNLTIVTATSPSFTGQLYCEYEVDIATDNSLTIKATAFEVSTLSGKTIKVVGSKLDEYDKKNIYGTYSVASINPTNKTITLNSFPYTVIWKGKISFIDTYTPKVNLSAGSASVVSTSLATPGISHTGKNSLLVSGTIESELYKLSLKGGKQYVISGWVKSTAVTDTITYKSLSGTKRSFSLKFYDANGNPLTSPDPVQSAFVEPSGNIIEGWQRLESIVDVPTNAVRCVLVVSAGSANSYFDDIRIYPLTGAMQTYVYNKDNYKVQAVLDNNNYATLYYYDDQGNLFLVKKETEKGIYTIQESLGHQRER